MILRGRRAAGSDFQGFRRRLAVLELLDLGAGPEAADALKAAFDFNPVSRDISLPWRDFAGDAGHPDVVVALVVPNPIAGDPDGIFRHEFGRLLGNVGRGLVGDDRTGGRIELGGIGEGFVNGALGKGFDAFFLNAFGRNRGQRVGRWIQIGLSEARRRGEECQRETDQHKAGGP
jgi:hypothetical protein